MKKPPFLRFPLLSLALAGCLSIFAAGEARPDTGQSSATDASLVLVEAEGFQDLGGWRVDTQGIDAMGSPYVLAHGLGEPVAAAKTTVSFPTAGAYRLWVRTRDWAGPGGPGRFRLHVAGKSVAKTFGAEGDGTWQWHDGGIVDLLAGPVKLELEDLAGFDGRCDAILFTKTPPEGFRPPNAGQELASFRHKGLGLPDSPIDAGGYDLVVAGGGYAGTCAAIASARLGLTVALIQDRPVLGGNASSEVRLGPIGGLKGPYRVDDIISEIHQGDVLASGGVRPRPDDQHVLKLVRAEKNIALHLETRVMGVEKRDARITAVVAKHTRTSKELIFHGRLFADCTGDATVGCLAGADWRMGREGRDETGETLAPLRPDKITLGASNFWMAKQTDRPSSFPACPWALPINDRSCFEVSTPRYPPQFQGYAYVGGWNWESGFTKDMIAETEAVRDHNLRAIFGTWDYLKNRAPDRDRYAKAKLEWVAFIAGKRESRRLLGDVILQEQDMTASKVYPDACVIVTWYFDMHFPHPDNTSHFPGQEFRSLAYDDPNFERLRTPDMPGGLVRIKPYPIPYRCFYSRNVPNLFMAGRDVSVTHVGLLPVRNMNTTAMMGTVVGRAAWLCRRLNIDPRDVYAKHWEEFTQILRNPKLKESP
jgi:hypothetical protein